MPLDTMERQYLDRQVTLTRAVAAALSFVALLETSAQPVRRSAILFLSLYMVLALAVVVLDRFWSGRSFRIPLAFDFAVLAVFFYLTPSVSACWFLFLFAVFALGSGGHNRAMLAAVGVATAAIVLRVALESRLAWRGWGHWAAVGLGTLISGLCLGYLGAREREHLERRRFLEKITGTLRFDRGLAQSIRQALGELATEFDCEQAVLAFRDDELERIFVWRVRPDEDEARGPETLPLACSEIFLLDSLETSLAWQFNGTGPGDGFGWDRRTGQRVLPVPRPPRGAQEELRAKSLLAVTVEMDERPTGRMMLLNPQPSRGDFSHGDLRWFERVMRHIGAPLENVYSLRGLRARAIEAERSRISRDLHDGILQTLLSLKIQLQVLRQTFAQKPEQADADLASLQKTLQQESEELRRMVTDLRPLRVESADMRELMQGFAERFRIEHHLAVDLFIEDRDLNVPDRICRELFQIYRESLHNIKKHADASHVVVKLKQDESKVSLVVDDNGRGFSFSGSYTSEQLDQLRLGPISIKERTRSVGGTLTVESNPGHGARLTVEIPFH